MLAISKSDAEAWCLSHGAYLDERQRPVAPARAHSFEIPQDAGRRIAVVAGHFRSYQTESAILVWYTEWGVWPSGERPHIFDRFRASYGETRPLSEVPAHLFGKSEADDALSFVTIGVLFLWDVYVVGASGKHLLHYSHDEVGWMVE